MSTIELDYIVILQHGYIADYVIRFKGIGKRGVKIGVKKKQFEGYALDRPILLEVAGNVFDLRQTVKQVQRAAVEWLDADHYIDLRTGEIKEAERSQTRGDKMSISQLRRSFREMRGIINSNFRGKYGEGNETLITLTYRENMQDPQRLYYDLQKFTQALKRRVGKIKYVTAVEPQGRGAWHAHILCQQLDHGKLVDKKLIAQLWQHGIIIDVENLRECDNVGAYLTAYLSNTPEDAKANESEVGKAVGKAVKKGNRLHMYPRGMHVYRASRNCKKPIKIKITPTSAEMNVIKAIAEQRYSASVDVFADDVNTNMSYLLNSLNHEQYIVNPEQKNSLIRNLDDKNREHRELLQALERMQLV